MEATVAITDYGWYEFLLNQQNLDEVNFWTPSAYWGFRAEIGSPFFFKLKAKYQHAVCGYAFFSRFVRLPEWLAWDLFQMKNGCPSLKSMQERIGAIRARIDYRISDGQNDIGCILLSQPTFFRRSDWVRGPHDWPPANLRNKKYSLLSGEGLRVWNDCTARSIPPNLATSVQQPVLRYGNPQLVLPRLGQEIGRAHV
jgi:putative restriction endonuclease